MEESRRSGRERKAPRKIYEPEIPAPKKKRGRRGTQKVKAKAKGKAKAKAKAKSKKAEAAERPSALEQLRAGLPLKAEDQGFELPATLLRSVLRARPKVRPYRLLKKNYYADAEVRRSFLETAAEMPACGCAPGPGACGPASNCVNRRLFMECVAGACGSLGRPGAFAGLGSERLAAKTAGTSVVHSAIHEPLSGVGKGEASWSSEATEGVAAKAGSAAENGHAHDPVEVTGGAAVALEAPAAARPPAPLAGVPCCGNAALQQRRFPATEMHYTKACGFGLRAMAPISAGTLVEEYLGEVITVEECKRRLDDLEVGGDYYFASLAGQYVLDAGPMGSKARFANHSCSPNCALQKWSVLGEPRVVLVALRDIESGDDLCYNYRSDDLNGSIQLQTCRCGRPNCCGVIGGKIQASRLEAWEAEVEDILGKARAPHEELERLVREAEAMGVSESREELRALRAAAAPGQSWLRGLAKVFQKAAMTPKNAPKDGPNDGPEDGRKERPPPADPEAGGAPAPVSKAAAEAPHPALDLGAYFSRYLALWNHAAAAPAGRIIAEVPRLRAKLAAVAAAGKALREVAQASGCTLRIGFESLAERLEEGAEKSPLYKVLHPKTRGLDVLLESAGRKGGGARLKQVLDMYKLCLAAVLVEDEIILPVAKVSEAEGAGDGESVRTDDEDSEEDEVEDHRHAAEEDIDEEEEEEEAEEVEDLRDEGADRKPRFHGRKTRDALGPVQVEGDENTMDTDAPANAGRPPPDEPGPAVPRRNDEEAVGGDEDGSDDVDEEEDDFDAYLPLFPGVAALMLQVFQPQGEWALRVARGLRLKVDLPLPPVPARCPGGASSQKRARIGNTTPGVSIGNTTPGVSTSPLGASVRQRLRVVSRQLQEAQFQLDVTKAVAAELEDVVYLDALRDEVAKEVPGKDCRWGVTRSRADAAGLGLTLADLTPGPGSAAEEVREALAGGAPAMLAFLRELAHLRPITEQGSGASFEIGAVELSASKGVFVARCTRVEPGERGRAASGDASVGGGPGEGPGEDPGKPLPTAAAERPDAGSVVVMDVDTLEQSSACAVEDRAAKATGARFSGAHATAPLVFSFPGGLAVPVTSFLEAEPSPGSAKEVCIPLQDILSSMSGPPARNAKKQQSLARHPDLHCYCGVPEGDGTQRTLAQCAGCAYWYHPRCVRTTLKNLRGGDFFCPVCLLQAGELPLIGAALPNARLQPAASCAAAAAVGAVADLSERDALDVVGLSRPAGSTVRRLLAEATMLPVADGPTRSLLGGLGAALDAKRERAAGLVKAAEAFCAAQRPGASLWEGLAGVAPLLAGLILAACARLLGECKVLGVCLPPEELALRRIIWALTAATGTRAMEASRRRLAALAELSHADALDNFAKCPAASVVRAVVHEGRLLGMEGVAHRFFPALGAACADAQAWVSQVATGAFDELQRSALAVYAAGTRIPLALEDEFAFARCAAARAVVLRAGAVRSTESGEPSMVPNGTLIAPKGTSHAKAIGDAGDGGGAPSPRAVPDVHHLMPPGHGIPANAASAALAEAHHGEANDDDAGGAYCICRGSDDGTFMVNCGGCGDWFHQRCMRFSARVQKKLAKGALDFECIACSAKAGKPFGFLASFVTADSPRSVAFLAARHAAGTKASRKRKAVTTAA